MLKGIKDHVQLRDPGCLETRELPATFLRLHSPRVQVALPYASLIKLELTLDETALELFFVTHRVTITGRSLTEIYRAVTEAEARLVRVVAADFADAAAVPSHKALVEAIRIEPLDADERRKQ